MSTDENNAKIEQLIRDGFIDENVIRDLKAIGVLDDEAIVEFAPTSGIDRQGVVNLIGLLDDVKYVGERYLHEITTSKEDTVDVEENDPGARQASVSHRIEKYLVVSNKTQAGLAKEVNDYISIGYVPFGGVSAAAFGISPVGGNQYIQAMVRYK